MDFVTVSTGLILPYWMGLPIRYIHLDSRSAAEGQLKGYLRNRGEWLDENIETLRQYSASSRVKQYNEVND